MNDSPPSRFRRWADWYLDRVIPGRTALALGWLAAPAVAAVVEHSLGETGTGWINYLAGILGAATGMALLTALNRWRSR